MGGSFDFKVGVWPCAGWESGGYWVREIVSWGVLRVTLHVDKYEQGDWGLNRGCYRTVKLLWVLWRLWWKSGCEWVGSARLSSEESGTLEIRACLQCVLEWWKRGSMDREFELFSDRVEWKVKLEVGSWKLQKVGGNHGELAKMSIGKMKVWKASKVKWQNSPFRTGFSPPGWDRLMFAAWPEKR
jgi:hypothetical protein